MTSRTYLTSPSLPTSICIVTEEEKSNTSIIIREWDHKRKVAGIFLVTHFVPTEDLPAHIANIFSAPSNYINIHK